MSIYDFTIYDVKQKEVPMSDFTGKLLLIVNTAPRCGYASQYHGLEKLHERYHTAGLEILDFPCNQFLNQAPGEDLEIMTECQLRFGIEFKTFAKIKVNGRHEHPMYRYLKDHAPEELTPTSIGAIRRFFRLFKSRRKRLDIRWNFTKFLVDRNGHVIQRFAPNFLPEDIEPYISTLVEKG